MTTMLVLFDPTRLPCVVDPDNPAWTLCDQVIGNAVRITDLQALVYLRNKRCAKCAPDWDRRMCP